MHITACYITKNEAQNLARSLDSIRGLYDDLLVVDTGSTDDTITIAQRAGARVLSFAWCDDFSAARNFALDHVRPAGGQAQEDAHWILFLDADESFVMPVHRDRLEDVLRSTDAEGFLVRRIEEEGGGVQSETWLSLRLFRFAPNLRYVGRIHEQVVNLADRQRPLVIARAPREMALYHTGYQANLSEEKARRNLALLEQEAREHGGAQPGTECYFAECLYSLGDDAGAIRWAEAAIESPVIQVGAESEPYHILLESLRRMGGHEAEMVVWASRAIARFPTMPEFYGERGMTYSAMGRWSEARRDLVESLILFEEDAPQTETRYFTRCVAGQIAARLGEIHALTGDRDEAATWFHLAERYAPESPRVQQKVQAFFKTQETGERNG